MKIIIVLLALCGAILAEAPVPYNYEPPQPQSQIHHHYQSHDQLNGFRPSHIYPCPDGIHHHNTDGRITNQHFESSGEPVVAPQLPTISHSDNQVTVNSQIAFGEHSNSHSEIVSAPSKGYIPPSLPVSNQQLPTYGPPPLPIQHQQINFHGNPGSIVHGIGKAQPPFSLNHHHSHTQIPIPVQQHRPIPQFHQTQPIRPQPQYIPPRQHFVQQHNFGFNNAHAHANTHAHTHTQSISVQTPQIADNLLPPPVGQSHSKFLEQNQFTASSHGSSSAFNSGFTSGSLNSITTGSNTFGSSASSASIPNEFSSSSGSIGFTPIGSTHNFKHPGLDEGLSQVISETFANAGVGENVEKHIYVHVPPDDLEERGHQHIPQQLPPTQPKKHYKIIFIKAPNQQPSTNVYTQIAQQQATEEKTLVYVLVKKPDEPTIQDIQQIQNTYKPSKPEVYFIKYKTHKEGGHQESENIDLTNGNFQGSDLSSGIDIRGSFNGDNNSIHETLTSNIIEPRIPSGNVPAPVYGPPAQN